MPVNRQIGNRFISEFHKDIVKTVAALPTPGANLSGFRRFRSSDNLGFFCTGTNWLSMQEYSVPFTGRTTQQTLSASGGTADRATFPEDRYSISLTRCVLVGAVATTHNASNYWRLDLYRMNANGSGSTLILADVARSWDTSASRTLGNFYPFKEQVGLSGVATLAPGVMPSFAYIITKVGAPGNLTLEIGGELYYRIVG